MYYGETYAVALALPLSFQFWYLCMENHHFINSTFVSRIQSAFAIAISVRMKVCYFKQYYTSTQLLVDRALYSSPK